MTWTISLLHATHRRAGSPCEVRDAWLTSADRPDLIDHIFALDADDADSLRWTADHRRVVSPALPGTVTAVRNWNAAAAACIGDILVVIADDLFPPRHWDLRLRRVIGRRLNPNKVPFAVKMQDGPQASTDLLMLHPVISRAFYDSFGLFDDRFTGIGCDMDLTRRALWHAAILDGRRELPMEHRRPIRDQLSGSTATLNETSEYMRARAVYNGIWSPRQRAARIRLVRTRPIPPTRGTLTAARLWNAVLARLAYSTYGSRSALRLGAR